MESEPNLHVLVVDPDERVRSYLQGSLVDRGWTVEIASSGKECLSKIEETDFDVALLAFNLPDMDAISILERLKEGNDPTPVVGLMEQAAAMARHAMLSAGAVDVVLWDLHTRRTLVRTVERASLRKGTEPAEGHGSDRQSKPAAAAKQPTPDVTRLLVVEDTAFMRLALRQALELVPNMAVVLDEAERGATALEMAAKNDYDMIFLDYVLPDIDGLEVLRRLGEAGNRAPVVALTGHGDRHTRQRFIDGGAADFMDKRAVTPDGIIQRVKTLVWHGRLQSKLRSKTAVRVLAGPRGSKDSVSVRKFKFRQ